MIEREEAYENKVIMTSGENMHLNCKCKVSLFITKKKNKRIAGQGVKLRM